MLDAAALPFACGVGGNLQLKDRFAEAVRHLFGLRGSPVGVFRSLQQGKRGAQNTKKVAMRSVRHWGCLMRAPHEGSTRGATSGIKLSRDRTEMAVTMENTGFAGNTSVSG